jgi:hypothetical protein
LSPSVSCWQRHSCGISLGEAIAEHRAPRIILPIDS